MINPVIKSVQCLHAFYFAEPAGGRLGYLVIHGVPHLDLPSDVSRTAWSMKGTLMTGEAISVTAHTMLELSRGNSLSSRWRPHRKYVMKSFSVTRGYMSFVDLWVRQPVFGLAARR